MTRQDLMQVYYIDKELKSWKKENICEEALKKKLSKKLSELTKARNDVAEFILNIEDPQTRLIFKLRCYDMLTWNAVADEIGGMNSEYTVKKRFYRYLEKCGA